MNEKTDKTTRKTTMAEGFDSAKFGMKKTTTSSGGRGRKKVTSAVLSDPCEGGVRVIFNMIENSPSQNNPEIPVRDEYSPGNLQEASEAFGLSDALTWAEDNDVDLSEWNFSIESIFNAFKDEDYKNLMFVGQPPLLTTNRKSSRHPDGPEQATVIEDAPSELGDDKVEQYEGMDVQTFEEEFGDLYDPDDLYVRYDEDSGEHDGLKKVIPSPEWAESHTMRDTDTSVPSECGKLIRSLYTPEMVEYFGWGKVVKSGMARVSNSDGIEDRRTRVSFKVSDYTDADGNPEVHRIVSDFGDRFNIADALEKYDDGDEDFTVDDLLESMKEARDSSQSEGSDEQDDEEDTQEPEEVEAEAE